MASDPAASLEDLLRAYQFHQGENLVTSSQLARQAGVNQIDLRVLLFLRRRRSATPKEVADVIDYASASVTAIVDRLESGGYVERTTHPTDRRSTILQLTAKGVATVSLTRAFYESAFEQLAEEDQRVASRALGLLTRAIVAARETNENPMDP